MKITSNLIDKYIQQNSLRNAQHQPQIQQQKSIDVLPSSNVNGISQVNANLPVSYTKIGEISVPGLENRASMYKLSNGQKVVILNKEGPVFIRTSFDVGSLNETDDKRGISHFIEHNLFNGSKGLTAGEYDKKLSALGGYTNAYTSFGETQYYLSLELLDDNSLEEAIKLNALQTQYPTFPDDALQREKEPVKSEIDMCHDDVSNRAYTIMLKNMFGLESSSEDIVIGTKENINNLTREDLVDYYNTYYTPDNAVTVITGDVDEKETIELVSKYYNKPMDYSKINQRTLPDLTPVNKPSRADIKQKNDPNALIMIGFPIDANIPKEDEYMLNILCAYMASNNSAISQKLDKYGAAFFLNEEQLSSDSNAAKCISASISIPEEYAEEVIKIIYDAIADLASNPPKPEDLQPVINSFVSSINTNEYSEDVSATLLSLVKNNDFNRFYDMQNTVKSMTPDDISNMARKYLDLSKVSMCVAHPESVSDEEIMSNYNNVHNERNQVSFGKSQNPVDRLSEYSSSVKQYKITNNNIQLALIPTQGTPKTNIRVNISSDANTGVSQSTAAVLTRMLNRGNSSFDNLSYKKELLDMNAEMRISSEGSNIHADVSVPAENSQRALSMLKQTLLSPNFSQEEFEQAKKIVRNSIISTSKAPEDKLMQHLLPDDKYFADKEEQLKDLDKLTLDDVKNLYYSILNNSQALISLSAPKDMLDYVANTTVNEFSSDFPVFREFVPEKDKDIHVYKPNTEEKLLTDTEENAQAKVVQSYQFKSSTNISDIAKIRVLNSILSDGMSSRLFIDLRNNEKLAYHVGSNILNQYDTGMINFEIETSTESEEASPDNVMKALSAFKRNVERLKTENVSQEELENAKIMLKTSILADLESSEGKLSSLENSINSAYGSSYLLQLYNAIDEVTVDDIKAAANYVFANPPVNSVVAGSKTIENIKKQQ